MLWEMARHILCRPSKKRPLFDPLSQSTALRLRFGQPRKIASSSLRFQLLERKGRDPRGPRKSPRSVILGNGARCVARAARKEKDEKAV